MLYGYVHAPGAGSGGAAASGLPERPDRHPMGAAGAAVAGRRPERPGPSGHRLLARDCERAAVHQTNRLPLALPAARSAAPVDGALLFREVDGGWDVGRGRAALAGTGPAAGR